MTDERKQEFTRRITNANKSEMIVILCDMFEEYVYAAKLSFDDGDKEGFKKEIRRARAVISELIKSVDRTNELGENIYQIYRYVESQLVKSEIRIDKTPMIHAGNLILKLNESYAQVAKMDLSGPVMKNAETVYAGMTYGKTDVNSNIDSQSNRGFFA